MPKSDFNKIALQLSQSELHHGCCLGNFPKFSKHLFSRKPLEDCI